MKQPITKEERRLLTVLAALFGIKPLDWSSPLYRAQWHPDLEVALAAVVPGFKSKPGLPRRLHSRRLALEFDQLARKGYLRRSCTQWFLNLVEAKEREENLK
jgi:hypothetical protein